MDFAFTPQQEQLRQEVDGFLDAELGADHFAVDQWLDVQSQPLSKKMSQRGWIGMTWPREYGGQAASYIDRLVVTEELLRKAAPVGFHWLGDRQQGPAVIKFGTKEQKEFFLPKIVNADISFCLLLSETEAGSDLSNVQTTAIESGDEFIVNGVKIWSSCAHLAHYGWLLAVTDPKAEKKHQALSEFVIDMTLPGIDVRPIHDASGEHLFNQVFLDNVHIPRNSLVGEKNGGWRQIMAQIDYERSGIERIMGNYQLLEGIIRYVRETAENGEALSKHPVMRQKIADLQVELEVGRLLIYRVAWLLEEKRQPTYESAMAKVFGTHFEQHLAQACTEILGLGGLLKPESKYAPLLGQAAKSYLKAPGYTIQGGTSEVLRGIIAGRALGM